MPKKVFKMIKKLYFCIFTTFVATRIITFWLKLQFDAIKPVRKLKCSFLYSIKKICIRYTDDLNTNMACLLHIGRPALK